MRDVPTHILVHVTAPAEPGGEPRHTRIADLTISKVDGGFAGEIPPGISLSGRFLIVPLHDDEEPCR